MFDLDIIIMLTIAVLFSNHSINELKDEAK